MEEFFSELVEREVTFFRLKLSPEKWWMFVIVPFLYGLYLLGMVFRGQINAIITILGVAIPFLISGARAISDLPLWGKVIFGVFYGSGFILFVNPEEPFIPRLAIPSEKKEWAFIGAFMALATLIAFAANW